MHNAHGTKRVHYLYTMVVNKMRPSWLIVWEKLASQGNSWANLWRLFVDGKNVVIPGLFVVKMPP